MKEPITVTGRERLPPGSSVADVTIIGGGLAGKAAALALAKAGLRVVCIEPDEPSRQTVGESLDWSAPALLSDLGLPMEHLVNEQSATWKRHVTLNTRDGWAEHYVPTPGLAGSPFRVELRTLHVDRTLLDQQLLKKTVESGVTIVREKVVRVEKTGRRVDAVHTESGNRFHSPWFIDASGFATSLFAREFRLQAVLFGPVKVAMWTYFPVVDPIEGTTLHMDPQASEYLDWIWEIPIKPNVISVGYAASGAAIKAKRERGLDVAGIFREQLEKFPRFAELLQGNGLGELNVTSFRCRVHKDVAGPNWLIAGEAASMLDPITANGVTAALRQAAEAAELILKYRRRAKLPWRPRFCYSSRVLQLAKFFNSGIEKIVYEPPVRSRIGMSHSGRLYTSPAWTMNLVYARLRPRGTISTFLFGLALGVFRAANWLVYLACNRGARATATPC
ncbi:MAG: FAD-dependent oxidoreductase [Candidatus Acidiferrum sp.]